MSGKCPKCGEFIDHVGCFRLKAGDPFADKSWALAYTCPSCSTILGCQVDPIALKEDTVDAVVERLRHGR
jgi:hypothetical protein